MPKSETPTQLSFHISPEKRLLIDAWKEEVYAEIINVQKAMLDGLPDDYELRSVFEDSHDMGYPYLGAIGGETTYQFTPTSVGLMVVVRINYHDRTWEKDFTEYDMW